MNAKFRVWDKQEKKMVYEGFHVFGEVSIFHLIDQYLFETKGHFSTLERYGDLIEMQWTGYENVYQGDILRSNVNGKLWVVQWDDYGWEVSNHSIKEQKYKFAGDESYWLSDYIKMINKAGAKVEVIGNIFANPEYINHQSEK